MNCGRYLFCTATAVLLILTQQTNGSGLGICSKVGNLLTIGCQKEKSLTENTSSESDVENGDIAKVILVLRNGYTDANNTVTAIEQQTMDGFATADKLLPNQPEAAVKAAQQGIEAGVLAFYDAGISVLQALGEALGLSNESARQGFSEASQILQVPALKLLDLLRTATSLTNQPKSTEGVSAQQSFETARQILKAGFATMRDAIRISLQKSTDVVSESQRMPKQNLRVGNRSSDAVEDVDASAAISEFNEAADESIKKGASPLKVNKLRGSVNKALGDLAKVAAQVRDCYKNIQKLADTDASLAKDTYLQDFDEVTKKLQEIFPNIVLDFGAIGLESESSSKKQIGYAIRDIEHGYDEVTLGNNVAKDLTIYAIELERNVRNFFLSAAIDAGRYGKIALIQRIIEGAHKILKIL